MSARILVIEDRDSLRRMLVKALESEGYQVGTAADGADGIDLAARESFDLVLTDLKLPGATGIQVLEAIRALPSPSPVVVMTAYGTVATAVEAMKLGAVDFLEKPVDLDELYAIVAAAVREPQSVPKLELPDGREIVGRHPNLRAALRLVEKVAPTPTTVLITGESGTGKELFARAVHTMSDRAGGPFVAVNCAAIPEALLENELFGHEKGAYTGANRREAGRFELAEGGTLLLDEIGELGLGVQSKILRVLEERAFERIGGSVTLQADVRLVATTNRDLAEMVAEKTFRSDLYYRLNVFPLHLPSLSERSEDIGPLADFLLTRAAQRNRVEAPRLSEGAIRFLAEQEWPGNVRQLANVIERAVIVSDAGVVGASDLADLVDAPGTSGEEGDLRRALEACDGDAHAAAERLGVSYRTVRRRILKYDLEGFPRFRD